MKFLIPPCIVHVPDRFAFLQAIVDIAFAVFEQHFQDTDDRQRTGGQSPEHLDSWQPAELGFFKLKINKLTSTTVYIDIVKPCF